MLRLSGRGDALKPVDQPIGARQKSAMEGAAVLSHRQTSCRRTTLFSRIVCGSVANLDAGPIPNAPIIIPNGRAARPVAGRPDVDGSGRYVDGGWRIVAGAGDRRSKQCANC